MEFISFLFELRILKTCLINKFPIQSLSELKGVL